ncbi:MAG: type II toxin-antitoxin system VapC family toxin [Myxococcales bacterium]|nr:type II toxin-antitoxin system VapC family toxin [Myxococcales bacterium]
MSSPILVDTAVVLQALVAGDGQPLAKALLVSGRDLVAPDTLLVELAGLVGRKQAKGELSDDQAYAILDAVPNLVRFVGVSGSLVRRAYELSRQLGIMPVDGVFLATAESLGAPLVTSDLVLLAKVQGTVAAAHVAELGSL